VKRKKEKKRGIGQASGYLMATFIWLSKKEKESPSWRSLSPISAISSFHANSTNREGGAGEKSQIRLAGPPGLLYWLNASVL